MTLTRTEPIATSDELRHYVPRLLVDRGPGAFADGFLEVFGTLMSADLSGFTKLSERLARVGKEGAEELTAILNGVFDGMIAAAHRNGGDIIKFGGDALLILFTGTGHVQRACRSALTMREIVAEPIVARGGARVRLRISQGLHTGRFGFFVAAGGHTELIVTGPATTETVRCEAEASAGEILLSDAAARAVDPAWLGRDKAGGRLLRRLRPEAFDSLGRVEDLDEIDLTGDGSRSTSLAAEARAEWLRSLVPSAQRDQIAAGAPSEHRRVTVAFVKFSHTDARYSNDGPAVLAHQLQQFAAIVGRATEEHGVHWLSSDVFADGGKVILTAGAPVSRGGEEERMLRTVRAILDGAHDAGLDLDLRAGVNEGPVFVGNLGSSERRTFTVMGDAVNLAARLMQKAERAQLVASVGVLERSLTRFATESLEPFFVKGKAKEIRAALVGRVTAVENRATFSQLPLIGRDAELATLRELSARVRAGSGQAAEIVGESGTGKSRLIEELSRLEPDLKTLTVICGPYARSMPYFAVRVLLRAAAGIDPMTPPDDAGEPLRRWVQAVAPDLLIWLPLIAVALDCRVAPTPESDHIAPEFRRARIHETIVELASRAITEPTMFVVEDAHHLDNASAELLATLAESVSEHPWLVCATRHVDTEPLTSSPKATTRIDLAPLPASAAHQLGTLAAGNATGILPADWDVIVERSAGNPLFVIELAVSASEHGSVDALPESVESVITARIDTIGARDRALLREAAVLGIVLELDLLADALGDAEIRDPRRWRALDQFVEEFAPGRLRFRHRLHRQVAYEGLSYRHRRELHRRVAEAIERRSQQNPSSEAELLSTHFFFAGSHERAWHYSVLAGNRARDKYANVEASVFFERALECARQIDGIEPRDIGTVAEALGDVFELSARFDEAAASFGRARKVIGGERDDALRLFRKEGVVRERSGRYRDALRWYSRGLRLCEGHDDPAAGAARAQLALAYAAVRHRQGRYKDSIAWAARAVVDAEQSGHLESLARAYFVLDIGHTYLGNDERMLYRGRALPLYEQLGDDVGLSIVLNNLGLEAYVEGNWDDALDFYARSRAACDRVGDVIGAATAVNNEGEILLDRGDVQQAADLFRDALRTWRAARYPIGVAIAAANLGLAEVRMDNTDAGLALLDEAVALVEELGAGEYVLRIRTQQIFALLLAGHSGEAMTRADELLPVLEANGGDESTTVMLCRVLGWVLLRNDRLPEAEAFLHDGLRRGVALDARYEVGLIHLALSDIHTRRGDPDAARREADLASEQLTALGVSTPP